MKHRKCNTKTLKQFSKDATKTNDVFQCIKKIKTLLSNNKDIEHSRKEDKDMIENCSRKCLLEVEKFKEKIIACAERLAKDMEDKISNAKNQLLADIESDINAVVEMSNQMEQLVSSFETLGQNVEDATFVLMLKETGNIEDGIEMKDDLLEQRKAVTIEFQRSDELLTLLSEITSMGRLDIKEKQLSFKDILDKTNKKVIDVGSTCVTGCVFMPDGELVICDYNTICVTVFTPELKLKNVIAFRSPAWDVAVVSKYEAILTTPDLKSLQFLTLSNRIERGKRIPIGMKCWGVDCKNERLYVSCHDDNGQGGVVKVLTIEGVTVNTLTISQGWPFYLAVNSSGDRILVSTYTNGVVCIDSTGKTQYTYSDSQVCSNKGLLVDSNDNFMVCGEGNDILHVVDSDGTKHRIIPARDDCLDNPHCLAYRPSDNTLVVGQFRSQALLAFTIK